MRYAVISDIHGNLEAFLKAIGNLSEEKVDKVLCAGDIVGYGANPIECIEKTKELDPVIVCGNHDRASCGLLEPKYFNKAAKDAIMWTCDKLGKKEVEFLKKLPLLYENRDLTMVHGTLQKPEKFYYMIDSSDALATFGLLKTRICFIGHSQKKRFFSFTLAKCFSAHSLR